MVSLSKDYFVGLVDELERSKETLIRRVQSKLGISYCDAQDCFQEAYVGLIESSNGGRLDANKSGRRYFCRALKNVCLDFLRSRRRRFPTLEDPSYFPSDAETPFNEAALQEELRNFRMVRDLIPPSCSEAFRLYVTEGLSRAEVAQRLGLRPNTVSVKVNRAMDFIRSRIGA